MNTEEYKGYNIEIEQDTYPMSPREWDNLGKLALFHRRYDFPNDDNISQDEAREILLSPAYIAIPVYGYDHGSISIKATFSRSYPYNCPWDSGMLGIVYVHKDAIREEWKKERISKELTRKVTQLLIGEVETYNQYLTGDIWGYNAINEHGESIGSCWGYYGDCETSGLLDDAKSEIDSDISEREIEETELINRALAFA